MSGFPERSRIISVPSTHPFALSVVVAIGLMTLATMTTIPLPIAGAFFIAAVPIFGPSAAIGGATGVFIHDFVRGAIGYWTVSFAVWLFTGAWLVCRCFPRSIVEYPNRVTAPWFSGLTTILCTYAIAGIISTAVAAWAATVLQGQPFHVAAAPYLWGVVATVGSGVPIGLFVKRRLDMVAARIARPGGAPMVHRQSTDVHRRDATRGLLSVRAKFGLLVVGVIWLGGVMVLDLLAHDLSLFATALELRHYAEGIVGHGTGIAAIVTAIMVGILRYGEPAVLLSVPIVAGIIGWLYQREVVAIDGRA